MGRNERDGGDLSSGKTYFKTNQTPNMFNTLKLEVNKDMLCHPGMLCKTPNFYTVLGAGSIINQTSKM